MVCFVLVYLNAVRAKAVTASSKVSSGSKLVKLQILFEK